MVHAGLRGHFLLPVPLATSGQTAHPLGSEHSSSRSVLVAVVLVVGVMTGLVVVVAAVVVAAVAVVVARQLALSVPTARQVGAERL